MTADVPHTVAAACQHCWADSHKHFTLCQYITLLV